MIKYDYKTYPWGVAEGSFPSNRKATEKLAFLLRYAILAPSSHNTQPWKFAINEREVRAYTNKDRWLRVADADERELHISLGCAIENLVIAAEHFGYDHHIKYFPNPANPRLVAAISLTETDDPPSTRDPKLFNAILIRHTNHKAYEQRSISVEDQQHLQACCVEEGITLRLTEDPDLKRELDRLVNRADAIQFADPAFREELGYWIGQGVFGTPWLLAKLSQLAVSYLDLGKWAAKKDSDVLMSAPLLAMICSKENDRVSQIKVGHVFERIYLTAAMLGISLQPMSQILQVPEIKAEATRLVGEGGVFLQQPFRLGYAEPEKEHTPRHPLEEALA